MKDKINFSVRAGKTVLHSITLIIDGKEITKTFSEWSRHSGCCVAKDTIRSRAQSGYYPHECVFLPHQQPTRRERPRKSPVQSVDTGSVRKVATMRWV